jgi:hypothetical protein
VPWIRKPGVSRNSHTFLALYCIVRNGTIKISFSFPVLENGTVQGKNPVPYQNRETKNPYRRSLSLEVHTDNEAASLLVQGGSRSR